MVHTPFSLFLQRIQLLSCLLKIRSLESFGEPGIAFGQQVSTLCCSSLLPKQASQAHRGPQFEGLGFLTASHLQRFPEAGLGLDFVSRRKEKQFGTDPVLLRQPPDLLIVTKRFSQGFKLFLSSPNEEYVNNVPSSVPVGVLWARRSTTQPACVHHLPPNLTCNYICVHSCPHVSARTC